MKKTLFFKPLAVKVISSWVIIAVFFASGTPVQARFFSFLGNLTEEASAQSIDENSQSIVLPTPQADVDDIKNPNLSSEVYIDNNALTPLVGPLGSSADTADLPVSDGVTLYVTHAGDTVSAIAKMFSVSPETIYLANDIKRGEALKSGITLIILPVTGIQYTVKKGDTLKGISKKFSVDSEDIIFYNDISESEALSVGDELIIPNAKITDPVTKKKSGTKKSNYGGSVQNTNGYFIRPCRCATRTQSRHGSMWHNGVDISSGSIGEPVWSAASGTVIIAKTSGWNGGAGRMIMIQHPNGSKTVYAHLNALLVTTGQQVKQGEQIGVLGNSGKSTGPHLHFEVSSGFTNPIISNPRYGL